MLSFFSDMKGKSRHPSAPSALLQHSPSSSPALQRVLRHWVLHELVRWTVGLEGTLGSCLLGCLCKEECEQHDQWWGHAARQERRRGNVGEELMVLMGAYSYPSYLKRKKATQSVTNFTNLWGKIIIMHTAYLWQHFVCRQCHSDCKSNRHYFHNHQLILYANTSPTHTGIIIIDAPIKTICLDALLLNMANLKQ